MNEDLSPKSVESAVRGAVHYATYDAVYDAVDDAVRVAGWWDEHEVMDRAVHGAVGWAMSGAVWWAVYGPVHPNIDKFVEETEQSWS